MSYYKASGEAQKMVAAQAAVYAIEGWPGAVKASGGDQVAVGPGSLVEPESSGIWRDFDADPWTADEGNRVAVTIMGGLPASWVVIGFGLGEVVLGFGALFGPGTQAAGVGLIIVGVSTMATGGLAWTGEKKAYDR